MTTEGEGFFTIVEVVDICVREEFCDSVRFKGREMKGANTGEGSVDENVVLIAVGDSNEMYVLVISECCDSLGERLFCECEASWSDGGRVCVRRDVGDK